MHPVRTGRLTLLALVLGVLPLAACNVSVREGERGDEVDVHSPLADISVRENAAPDTGLPVYPGATPVKKGDDVEGANVSVNIPFVDISVAAATYESAAAPQAIVEFYREAMRGYGEVVECRGEIDFERRGGSRAPVCTEARSDGEIQLAVGAGDDHRLVSVKPRGGASEFAVVHVRTKRP